MVALTNESMQAARQWFHDNAMACISEAESGEVKVNYLEKFREWKTESAADALAGKYDHTLSFLQRAHYIQTGECVALLP